VLLKKDCKSIERAGINKSNTIKTIKNRPFFPKMDLYIAQ